MFSYRHAFHAGNHADVLKHAVLVQILDYFARKDSAFWIIDTHAGAGLYALDGAWSSQSGEADDGLRRLFDAPGPPALVAAYLQALEAFNPDGRLRRYPGSPCLAAHALRPQDRLRLFELHPTEIDVLRETLRRRARGKSRQIIAERLDGFIGLQRLLPPPARRGITLIDPSYEDKHDYRRVLHAVQGGLQRFAQGTYVIWYPLVQRVQAHELPRALKRLPVSWLDVSLTVRQPAANGLGMHGSGLFVINPPWTLQKELRDALPWLKDVLAQDHHAHFQLEHRDNQKRSPGRK